jgi:hypothetical protein
VHAQVSFVHDIVSKVFLGCRPEIFRPADALCGRGCEGPHRLVQKRSRRFVSTLLSIAVVESAKKRRLREFRRRSIFEFCNNICHKPTSLERPETNTLSVGAHPRDGESVEAKGMPKVK